jgi:hypothetical protein
MASAFIENRYCKSRSFVSVAISYGTCIFVTVTRVGKVVVVLLRHKLLLNALL